MKSESILLNELHNQIDNNLEVNRISTISQVLPLAKEKGGVCEAHDIIISPYYTNFNPSLLNQQLAHITNIGNFDDEQFSLTDNGDLRVGWRRLDSEEIGKIYLKTTTEKTTEMLTIGDDGKVQRVLSPSLVTVGEHRIPILIVITLRMYPSYYLAKLQSIYERELLRRHIIHMNEYHQLRRTIPNNILDQINTLPPSHHNLSFYDIQQRLQLPRFRLTKDHPNEPTGSLESMTGVIYFS